VPPQPRDSLRFHIRHADDRRDHRVPHRVRPCPVRLTTASGVDGFRSSPSWRLPFVRSGAGRSATGAIAGVRASFSLSDAAEAAARSSHRTCRAGSYSLAFITRGPRASPSGCTTATVGTPRSCKGGPRPKSERSAREAMELAVRCRRDQLVDPRLAQTVRHSGAQTGRGAVSVHSTAKGTAHDQLLTTGETSVDRGDD